jgi:hypothetical protein
MDVKYGKKVFIRNAGKDEYWLQDMIYDNPSILGLGNNVKPLNREKSQSSGGRLDILLKDVQDKTMYEVEVMLGETDPSHIIRSIEYWDNEKRKYPQRQHFSVLVAESFERRYFNVIQILSINIPMIAIQADLLEVNKEYILNFNKILDVYEEPEDNEEATPVNESSWNEKSSWTLNTAKELFSLVETDKKSINYTQSYISIVINGRSSYKLDKRTQPTSILWFNVKDDEKADAIRMVLDKNNIVYSYDKYKDFVINNIDQNMIKSKKAMFQEIIKIKHKEIFSDE